MKLVLKFVVMFFLILQLHGLRIAQAEEVGKSSLIREYAVTPLAALTILEALDQFPKLSDNNFKLAIGCSDYDLKSIRKQLLRGYFQSTLQEVDGKLIHNSAPFIFEDTVKITSGVTRCLKILVETAYAYEIKNFEYETYSVQRLLGLYEGFISLQDTFDDELKLDLSNKAQLFRELRSVLPTSLQFHLSGYLISLRKRQIINAIESSKK